MALAKYIGQVLEDGHISLPAKTKKELKIFTGDKIKVTLRKISEKDIKNHKNNPLYQLIGLCENGREDASANHDKYLYGEDH